MELAFALIGGHFLADFPLQGEYLANQKQFAMKHHLGTWALSAHACIQGLMAMGVLLALGYEIAWLAGMAVAGTHWLIDFGKIRNRYGFSADQYLHLVVLACVWGGYTWQA